MVARLAGPATGLLPVVVAPRSDVVRRVVDHGFEQEAGVRLAVLQDAGAEAVEAGGTPGDLLGDDARVPAGVEDGDGGIGHEGLPSALRAG